MQESKKIFWCIILIFLGLCIIANLQKTSGEQITKTSQIVEVNKSINRVNSSPDVYIDIEKIIFIESSGNPSTPDSSKGARGLMQIMQPTWEEMVKKLGKNWSWEEAKDPVKNRIVGTYYMNIEIPRLLKHYGIEDNIENRIAAYDWGIGNLKKKSLKAAPQETKDYIRKYKNERI